MAQIIPFISKDDLRFAEIFRDFLAMKSEEQADMIALCIGILHLAGLKRLLPLEDLIEMFMDTMESIDPDGSAA